MSRKTTLMLGGDVMLGRLVKDAIFQYGHAYPLSKITPILRAADIALVNLECAITDSPRRWRGDAKAFYFGAPSEAILTLVNAGISVVNLANNHLLDFDYQGLQDTLETLDQYQIHYTGAGLNLQEARKPCYFKANDLQFAMIAYCDHQHDFAATENKSGISYLDLSNVQQACKTIQQDFLQCQSQQIDWPILSMHWGPNMVKTPCQAFIDIAHFAIDIGYKIIFGHSAHVFQGIEIYKNCPIIYAAGDLVDDYAVDPIMKNDHGLLFELVIDNQKLHQIKLHPVFIENFQTIPATGLAYEFIEHEITNLCADMQTQVTKNKASELLINVA